MGKWYARALEGAGVPASKVFDVGAGMNVLSRGEVAPPARKSRLLFVGRDFRRKGGAEVVAAVGRVRRSFDRSATLTVVGPERWPLDEPPGPGVTFLGRLGLVELAKQFASHDLFVMPSHFEAFGISFLEALAHKVPCVGREAWEMPTLLGRGLFGRCVESAEPEEIAETVVACLTDDALYKRVETAADAIRRHWSWDRVARDMLSVIDGEVASSARPPVGYD